MSNTIKILAFAGSTRTDSINKKLVAAAAEAVADPGASVTWIDLKDFVIPLYDGDIEAESGQPAAALTLRALFKSHDALLIASPEYNGFFSPLVKNTFDWLSRPLDGEERHAAFKSKPTLLLATTRGESGGGRGLQQLRQLLQNLKALPHEEVYLLPKGNDAFDENGKLKSEQDQARLSGLVNEFIGQLRLRIVRAA
ncbi:NAD(P)H-dependent oxidoreductase [Janthinobacterium sp. 17J80-10]|uniref:NADPH-dependent FMN reductase n=1 Tax=Janthinobacterium sp. 17J80-10 TaxID=2497863 RepID=UPI00100531E2|nr:NAD(P)H-dependent oxidoreductase [Janthinobacterium sp. 17J80-10]QAU34001.1 NADPH-dependent oxidoreductase [Janthinobacterium sp. 17J80-10]